MINDVKKTYIGWNILVKLKFGNGNRMRIFADNKRDTILLSLDDPVSTLFPKPLIVYRFISILTSISFLRYQSDPKKCNWMV